MATFKFFKKNLQTKTKEEKALGMLCEWGSRFELLQKKHFEEHQKQDFNGKSEQIINKFGYRIKSKLTNATSGDRYTVYHLSTPQGVDAVAKICPTTSPLIKFFNNEVRVHNALEKIIRDFEFETNPFSVPKIIQFITEPEFNIFVTQYLPINEISLEDRVNISEQAIKFFRLTGRLLLTSGMKIPRKNLKDHYHLTSYYINSLKQQGISLDQKQLSLLQKLFHDIRNYFDYYNQELIHGDLHTEHLIPYNNKIFLVDWEHARIGNCAENIAAVHNIAEILNKKIPAIPTVINQSHFIPMLRVMRIKQSLRGMFFSKICRDDPEIFNKYYQIFNGLTKSSSL